ncbi:hypothetical protein HanPI659440_Chr11g0439291 [Helianthus annuus]|nr:hypothetical protein HanPI659440_Chr11g0439291 [Helianthus annuus]
MFCCWVFLGFLNQKKKKMLDEDGGLIISPMVVFFVLYVCVFSVCEMLLCLFCRGETVESTTYMMYVCVREKMCVREKVFVYIDRYIEVGVYVCMY